MNKKEFTERLAAGLRNMDVKPNYLAIIAFSLIDWEFDEKSFSQIPIVKISTSMNVGYGGRYYEVIPCFDFDVSERLIEIETYNFQRGFDEANGCSF